MPKSISSRTVAFVYSFGSFVIVNQLKAMIFAASIGVEEELTIFGIDQNKNSNEIDQLVLWAISFY